MPTILRGKYKGEFHEIHQHCNDWFSLEDLPTQEAVFSPLSLSFTAKEVLAVRSKKCGTLFHEYYFVDKSANDWRFRKAV